MVATMMHRLASGLGLAATLLCIWGPAAWAQTAKPLALDGEISADGTKMQLSWEARPGAKAQVFRRELGQTGADTWRRITPDVLTHSRMLDTSTRAGIAYEYKVHLEQSGTAILGYWATGRDVPLKNEANAALMVIDETLAEALAPELARFRKDLIGAGWRVSIMTSKRGDRSDRMENIKQALVLRERIAEYYRADPFSDHTVILIGHLPLIRSGRTNPDGHEARSFPTDLIYADPEGEWQGARDDKGRLQFRPTLLPADKIAMQIGRIDFSNLTKEFGEELDLLKAYFDKNHAFRHGKLAVPLRAYGQSAHLEVERNALRNIVGPSAVLEGGHHDTNGKGPFLFGVDFGEWKWETYYQKPPSEAVFTINFGSRKYEYDLQNNPMTALLSQPKYPLVVGWGGRPAWQLHGMAMGESIGRAHLRTVNNGTASDGGLDSREYALTGRYDWVNPAWVNLLGDPTLTAFPVAPVRDLTTKRDGAQIELTWTTLDASNGAVVFRGLKSAGPYRRISGRGVVKSGRFVDPDPIPGAWYMVRAQALNEVHAGSFQALSQAAFAGTPE